MATKKYNFQELFDVFSNLGIDVPQESKAKITKRMNEIFSYEPRVGIFGKTGAGKSSLCNAVFGDEICPISDIAACTRAPKEVKWTPSL